MDYGIMLNVYNLTEKFMGILAGSIVATRTFEEFSGAGGQY